MATVNGAQAIPAWRGRIGQIKRGYRADLVLLKPGLRLRPLRDIVHQLVFCESGQSVDTVLVDGKVVVEGGRLTLVDENALLQKVEPISRKMHRLYGRIKNRPDRSRQQISKLYNQSFSAKGLPLRLMIEKD
jgi:hypothetical protein